MTMAAREAALPSKRVPGVTPPNNPSRAAGPGDAAAFKQTASSASRNKGRMPGMKPEQGFKTRGGAGSGNAS
jgi:hypothetical protein